MVVGTFCLVRTVPLGYLLQYHSETPAGSKAETSSLLRSRYCITYLRQRVVAVFRLSAEESVCGGAFTPIVIAAHSTKRKNRRPGSSYGCKNCLPNTILRSLEATKTHFFAEK